MAGWLASLDLRKPYTSRRRILSHRITSRDPPRLILVNTNTLARQSRALSTNTQGIQGERKGKGVAHARFGHGSSVIEVVRKSGCGLSNGHDDDDCFYYFQSLVPLFEGL